MARPSTAGAYSQSRSLAAWHEAMAVQDSQDPPNTVLSVIQKGYSLNGRLLRPARVIVSKCAAGGN